MVSAMEVAQYLIHLASPSESEDSDCLCHMRLQKLLYYVQGWHLAAFTATLFDERIEAWKSGPVVKDLYPRFAHYGYQAITPREGADPDTFSARQKAFIQTVWDQYRNYSATALSHMTHRESPWVDARGGLPADATSDAEITPEAMRLFFRARLVERLKRHDPRIDPVAWGASGEAIVAGRTRTVEEIRLDLHRRRAGPDRGSDRLVEPAV